MEIVTSCCSRQKKRVSMNWTNSLLTMLLSFSSFFITTLVQGQTAENPKQGSNGSAVAPQSVTFQNGNLHSGNAHFLEGHSIPYQLVMTGLTPGNQYVIKIGMDALEGGAVAIDYVTSIFNLTPHTYFGHSAETINPLQGTGWTEATFGANITSKPLPAPTHSPKAMGIGAFFGGGTWINLDAAKKSITIFGASAIGNITYDASQFNMADIGQGVTAPIYLIVPFTAGTANAVIAWGGHIAAQLDYGLNTTAATEINGAPYHTRRSGFTNADGSIIYGNEGADRSVQIDAIVVCVVTPGEIGGTQSICTGGDPVAFTSVSAGTATGELSYQWQSNTTGCGGTFTNIVGATGPIYDPPSGLTQTTYYRRLTYSDLDCNDASNCITVTVVNNPAALVLTGSSICASNPNTGTVTSGTSVVGVTYQLKKCSDNSNVQAAKPGTGAALSWTGLATGCYYAVSTGSAPTNCTATSNQVNVSEVANPVALVLTGSAICATAPGTGTVTSTTSQVGVTYQLKKCSDNSNVQGTKAGTGSGLTWTDLPVGCYYAVGTGAAPTNCTSTSNQVNVTEVANPIALVLTGSSICATAPGTGTVTSTTSQSGVSYQLKKCSDNSNVQSAKAGTGAALSWTDLPVGCYYAVGTGAAPTNCTSTSNQVNVTEVANPIALVLSGNSICASNPNTGIINSTTSQSGVSYQLKKCSDNSNVQSAKAGTGAALSWTGLAAGCYYAVGTGAAPTNCTSTSNQASVTEVADPIALVLSGNSICASDPNTGIVSSTTSQSGVSYQLKKCSDNSNVQSAKAGTGSALSWTGLAAGCYYAVGTGAAPTNCTSTSNQTNVTEVANPIALVLNGGSICASNPGTGTISSTTSQSGVSYQLKKCSDNSNVQSAKAGTGAALSWTGLAAGCYYAVGTGAAPTNCTSTSNQASVTEIANPVALILSGSSICATAPGTGTVSSTTSQSGVSYQLKKVSDNSDVQAPKAGTGAGLTWTGLAAGSYYAVGTAGTPPTICTSQSNNATVTEVANPIALILSGNSICASDPNTGIISSTTSQSGVSYQLKKCSDNSNVQSAKAGTGAALSWTGLAAGCYYAVGTGAAPTNCTSTSNQASVTEVANPIALVLSGNSICASNPNTGIVSSTTSQSGVSYQLKKCSDNSNVQSAKAGTGAALSWTGLAAGCYYAVGTGAAPTNCTSTSNQTNVTEVANPVALVLSGNAICATAPGTGIISSTTSQSGVSYQLKKCSDNSNVQSAKAGTGAALTWTGLDAGCYYAVGTGAAPTNCTSTSNQATVTEVANPLALVLSGSAICPSSPGTGTISSTTSQSGVSYQLKKCSDNSNVQSAKAGTGAALTWTGLATGCYYVVGTGAAPTNCTSTSNQASVTDAPVPVALVLNGSSICTTAPNTGTITSTTSQVGVNYQLKKSSDNSNVQAPKAGTGAGLTWTNLATGSYYVTGTFAAPPNCSSNSNTGVVESRVCANQICTYTQGAYGSEGGMMCNGQEANPGPNQFNTFETITNSINSYTINSYSPPLSNVAPFVNQVLVVGKPGRSVYMNSSADHVNAVIDHLPGGGSSKELIAANYAINALPASYLKNGRINNTLLAQTITLGLNLGIGTSLNSFQLQGGVLVTADAVDCGSNVALTPECNYNLLAPYNLLSVTNDYHYTTISAAVVAAIPGSPKTVAGLFELANRALADADLTPGTEAGVSLNAIASAVDAINNAFDECRLFVGWDITACAPFNPPVQARSAVPSEVGTANALAISAFPNPFTDKVRFVIDVPTAGNGSLEVYNTLGQNVGTVYRGLINAGKGQVFEYNVPAANRTNLFYVLRVNGQQVAGKLLSLQR